MGGQAGCVEWPLGVALARPVQQLPTGPWAYEIKVDSHRTVLWRTQDGVQLQSRSGRDVTPLWMDLAVAAMRLPSGTVLDGEAVMYLTDSKGGARISFEAAQSRALSSPSRARELAAQHPATYVAFDALAVAGSDLRPRPYAERRQALVDVLVGIGPPIEPVWWTTDRDEPLLWYETLKGTGVEGIVAKPIRSAYKAGRIWPKIRHAVSSRSSSIPSTDEPEDLHPSDDTSPSPTGPLTLFLTSGNRAIEPGKTTTARGSGTKSTRHSTVSPVHKWRTAGRSWSGQPWSGCIVVTRCGPGGR